LSYIVHISQVHGVVAEEGACIRVLDCMLRNNKTSAASGADPSSLLTLTRSIATQSGKGVLIVNGASGQAFKCSLEFNEDTAATVQDPGVLNAALPMSFRWKLSLCVVWLADISNFDDINHFHVLRIKACPGTMQYGPQCCRGIHHGMSLGLITLVHRSRLCNAAASDSSNT